jgi:hypothetical protein
VFYFGQFVQYKDEQSGKDEFFYYLPRAVVINSFILIAQVIYSGEMKSGLNGSSLPKKL